MLGKLCDSRFMDLMMRDYCASLHLENNYRRDLFGYLKSNSLELELEISPR